MNNINKIIKDKRLRLGLTQEEFANYVGISRGTISHHEQGRKISLKLLREYDNKLQLGLLETNADIEKGE